LQPQNNTLQEKSYLETNI